MNKFITFLFLLLVIIACNRKATIGNTGNALQKKLIGQWRNITIHIDIITANNTDKNVVWESNESNWEERLKIKPIHTYFNNDHTFYSEYYDLKDSLFYHPSGKWTLHKDTLTFYYQQPKADTLFFTVSIKDDVATFNGLIDWDADGKKDDIYNGTQRKQP